LAKEQGEPLAAASCGIGTIKSNIGHLELAAGVAGVIKVLLQLQHRQLVASLNSEPPNPHINLSDSPFYVVKENRPWERLVDKAGRELPRRAGVSSFGFGGVNAHVVLEEYVAPVRAATPVRGPVAVVLSARSQERLQVQVQQLLTYLDEHEVNLADLAYTLQVGREALGVRLAAVVNSVEELKGKLAHVSQNTISGLEDLYQGEVKRSQETLAVFRADEELQEAISKWVIRGKVGKLAELWVQGLVVDWAALYGESKPQRLSLPTYPFAPERYWVPEAETNKALHNDSSLVPHLHPLVI
jgi:polyketide synthase PksN